MAEQDLTNLNSSAEVSYPPRLKMLIKKIDELPVLPGQAVQALKMSMQEDVELAELAKLVESDPSLTLKVLKLVNRASTGLSHKVSTVQQAVSLLGLTTLRCSLLGVITQDYLRKENASLVQWQQSIWSHSLACAVSAQLIAERASPGLQQEAFVAAMLHDMGKVVMLHGLPEEYLELLEDSGEPQGCLISAEQEALHCNHTQVGKWLAKKWGLPKNLSDAAFFHHQPVAALEYLKLNHELLYTVQLANNLAREYFLEKKFDTSTLEERKALLGKLGLGAEDVEAVQKALFPVYRERAGLFNLQENLEDIYYPVVSKANRKLSTIALELESAREASRQSHAWQAWSNDIATRLSESHTYSEVFAELVQAFEHADYFRACIVYAMDTENWILEGRIWQEEKKNRQLLCFLDKEGRPIWDQQTCHFSKGLKDLLNSYKDRVRLAETPPSSPSGGASKEGFSITYHHPFYVIPLASDSIGLQGELCVVPSSDRKSLSREARLILQQVARLTANALERIKINERLESKNEELSLALWKNEQMHNKLLQTERLAAVGHLAAGAAHEINNPLAIINARSQLMQYKEKDPQKQKQFKQITEQIERISSILTKMMDFARPAPPVLTALRLPDILDRVVDLAKPGLKKYGIEVRREYQSGLPQIKADPHQLEQVFLNLIMNAQHAMEDQGGSITLRVQKDEPDKHLLLAISDEGEGISSKDLKKIFDPFFSTKEPGKGTGLGLSTSMSIIENHFGKLWLESEIGAGTTVHIKLPLNLEELRQINEDQPASPAEPGSGRQPRVLVVDDEQHIQDILSEALTSEGMEPVGCFNGQEALKLLDEDRFDLLLLDMRMPLLDGLSLIKAVKEKKVRLPIIVITGMASHEEIEKALSQGVYKCIRKPFHIRSLLKDVKEVLIREGALDQPVEPDAGNGR